MEKKLRVFYQASRTVVMGDIEDMKLTYCSSVCNLLRCPHTEQTCKNCEYNILREDKLLEP